MIPQVFRTTVALAAVALALTACSNAPAAPSEPVSGSWDDVVAAANNEGKVTI